MAAPALPELESLIRSTLSRQGLADQLDDDVIPPLAAFAALLIKHGKRTNLVGTTEPARLVDEVIVDALQTVPLLPEGGGRLLDVGSGAGIPGIALAIARPAWHVVSVEPREKRVMFQQTVRRALGLENVTVVAGRFPSALDGAPVATAHGDGGAADERRRSRSSGDFDAAVTKAVWAPEEWIERGRQVVRDGGSVLVYANRPLDFVAPAATEVREYTLADGRRRACLRIPVGSEGGVC